MQSLPCRSPGAAFRFSRGSIVRWHMGSKQQSMIHGDEPTGSVSEGVYPCLDTDQLDAR